MIYFTVYKTTNKIPGQYYIGAHRTENPNDEYLGSGLYLTRAIKKYGRDNFKKEILVYCDNAEEMFLNEYRFVNVNDPKSYNIKPGGLGGNGGHATGIRTQETRKNISDSLTGRTLSKKHRCNISKSKTGTTRKPFSKEHKFKLSESLIRYRHQLRLA